MGAGSRTAYRRGRTFEHRVRQALEDEGYYVCRSAGSRSPVDLIAIRSAACHQVVNLFVQCKANGQLRPTDWNDLYDLATSYGAWPILAARAARGTVAFTRLLDLKDGSRRRQPHEPIDVATICTAPCAAIVSP